MFYKFTYEQDNPPPSIDLFFEAVNFNDAVNHIQEKYDLDKEMITNHLRELSEEEVYGTAEDVYENMNNYGK